MLSLKEFGAIMAAISAAYGIDVPRDRMTVYYEYLKDIPADSLRSGVDKLIMTRRYSTFPLISDIRAAALGSDDSELDDRARLAWEKAKRAIIAGYSDDETLDLAIKIAFGGWKEFGDTDPENEPSDRRHFIACYKLAAREMAEPRLLKGSTVDELKEVRTKINKLEAHDDRGSA